MFDEAIEGWKADPTAMRKKLLDAATDTSSLLHAMMMATQEQTAFGALIRGENTVVFGDLDQCINCSEMLVKFFGPGMEPSALVMRRPIWMGPITRWVCEVCMTKMPDVKYTPNFKEINHASTN